MKIAQISDLHMGAEGRTLGIVDAASKLEKLVSHINGLQPDLVLVSGDIAHEGSVAETTRAAALLADLTAPYYLTPGNHDTRSALQTAIPAAALPAREAGHMSYYIEAETLRIIALDSSDPDAPHGRICAARAAWLEAALAASDTPTLIFMHHPPIKFAVEETDKPPMEGANLLAKVVARHPQIERILCGHIHLMAQALWHGRLVMTAPSLGMRLSWHSDRIKTAGFFNTPPAFLWHMHNEDGVLVSHEFTLDQPDGPYQFS
jgi:3',5'-cyclic AMP phosphodiesterase CpdA